MAANDGVRERLEEAAEAREAMRRLVDAGAAEVEVATPTWQQKVAGFFSGRTSEAQPRLAELICPINRDIMVDPVTAEDGYTYSRANILRWMAQCKAEGQAIVSPRTRAPMGKDLTPNEPMRERLDRAINHHIWGGEDEALADVFGGEHVRSMGQLNDIFAVLDGLDDVLQEVLEDWEPPRVVVIGTQSHGKSTVLERLCMVPMFPHAEMLCTSVPVKINVRRPPRGGARPPSTVEVWDTMRNVRIGDARIITMDTGAVDIREVMARVIADENANVGVRADRELRVYIYSSILPPMNLVDLPGTIEFPEARRQRTHELVRRYIAERQDSSVFLVVTRAEGSSPAACSAMRHIHEYGATGRTIGVLTFCDRVRNEEGFDLLRGWLSNREDAHDGVPLKPYGWVATMNEELRGMDGETNLARLRRQATREPTWFRENGLGEEIERGRATSDALVDKVGDMYKEYVLNTFIPNTVRRLLQERAHTSALIASLGVPASPGDIASDVERTALWAAATEAGYDILAPCFAAAERAFVTDTLKGLQTELIEVLCPTSRVGLRDVDITLQRFRSALEAACLQAKNSFQTELEAGIDDALAGNAGEFMLQRFPRYVASLRGLSINYAPRLGEGTLDTISVLLDDILCLGTHHVQLDHDLDAEPPVAVLSLCDIKTVVSRVLNSFILGFNPHNTAELRHQIEMRAGDLFGMQNQECETCHDERVRLQARDPKIASAVRSLQRLRIGEED